jgi:hypothetical protein
MFLVRTKSGAEVTATSRRSVAKAEVQTLREFRRRSNFAKRLGVRQPSGALGTDALHSLDNQQFS